MRETKAHTPFDDRSDDASIVEAIVVEYVDRLNAGEHLDPFNILAEHPELGAEVLAKLEVFRDLGPHSQTDEPLGTLGDYTLRRQIGRGGMGVVYEAWENSMDRRVALKVLPAGIAADTKACTRFMREAQTAGKLNHPNVVGVYSTGVKEGTPWYSMEFVDGETLAQIVARTADVEPDTETVFGRKDGAEYFQNLSRAFADVADGLQHAHSKGVVHRDIKPSNLILDAKADQGGRPKLRILDFGLARLEGQESLTLSGDLMGTVLYMSPEQAMAKRIPLDHRTDVYSLGATMYEMLTGRPPFRGKDSQSTLSEIMLRDPQALRKLNPRISQDLETIVLKCLRKEAGDRYDTAEGLARDLRRFAAGDPIEARPQPAWEKLARRLWRSKVRLGVRLGVAAVIISLLAVLGYMLLEPRGMAIRQVWKMPPYASAKSIWADRHYVSYTEWNTGNLAVYDLFTEESHPVTNNPPYAGGWNEDSAISPDGKEIAYTWFNDEGKFYDLRLINRDGTDERVLYHDPLLAWIDLFAWSPDGKYLLAAFYTRTAPLGDDYKERKQLSRISVGDQSISALATWDWDKDKRARPQVACFSPDGRYVAFDLEQEGGTGRYDIFLIDLNSNRRQATALVSGPWDDRLLGWVPDGADRSASTRILFTSDRISGRKMWLAEVKDGELQGKPKRVRQVPEFEGDPIGFTRDGSYYYVVSTATSGVYLADVDPDSGKVVGEPREVSSLGDTSMSAWSPDGKRLVYAVRPSAMSRDWLFAVYDMETDREILLEPFPSLQSQRVWRRAGPRWSRPDGRHLLVKGSTFESGEGLYKIDIENRTTELISERGGTVWSPDGRSSYYVRGDPTREQERRVIVKRDLESGAEIELSRGGRSGLDLSPDGQWLAFYENYSLFILPSAGGQAREVVPRDETNHFVRWTPDGQHLLFVRGGRELWRVEIDSRDEQKIYETTRGRLRSAVLQPPDGRRLAFTLGQEGAELWVMENFLPEVAERE